MPPKEITIYDIAQELKVSPTTVSRALNDHFSIGKETTKAVKELASKWGYQPNTIAAKLRRQKTNSIGVLIPWINRPFISSAISGIEEKAHAAGYSVTISQSRDSYEKEVTNAKTFLANRVDGLIVSLALETEDYQHFAAFRNKGIPVVFFDRVSPDLEGAKVIINNREAGFKATEHLIQNGYRRIAHIAGSQNRLIYQERLNGYLDALQKYQLSPDTDLIIQNQLTPEDGEKGTAHLMNLPQPPDAIFTANDNAGVSAIQYLKRNGYRVPQDVAVVGFNNDPVSQIIEPALTTIHHPAFDMGKLAAQEFLNLVNAPENTHPATTILLETELIIRESSTEK